MVNYDFWLSKVYGDYMTVPKKENQKASHWNKWDRMKNILKNQNIFRIEKKNIYSVYFDKDEYIKDREMYFDYDEIIKYE